jgi:hypothetical protein
VEKHQLDGFFQITGQDSFLAVQGSAKPSFMGSLPAPMALEQMV